MNYVSKRALSRRTLLRGAGVAIALPLLDSMVPALTAQAKTAANAPLRFGVVYEGNGTALPMWLPKTTGADFELSPTLKPLEPFRSQVLVVSGLSNKPG